MNDLNGKDLLSVHGMGETAPKEAAPRMSASRERLCALESDFQSGKMEPALSSLRKAAEEADENPSDSGFAALLLARYYGGSYPLFSNDPDWGRVMYYSEIAIDAGYFEGYAHTAMAQFNQGEVLKANASLDLGVRQNDLLSLQYMLREDIQKMRTSLVKRSEDDTFLANWGVIYSAMNRYIRHPANRDEFIKQDLRSKKTLLLQKALTLYQAIVDQQIPSKTYEMQRWGIPPEIKISMDSQPDETDLPLLRQIEALSKPVHAKAGEKSVFNRPDRKHQTRIALGATIVALVLLWLITYTLPRHVPVYFPFMLRRLIPTLFVIGVCRQRHRVAGTHFLNNAMKFTGICALGLLVFEFLNREGAVSNWLYYRMSFLPFSYGRLLYLLFLLPYLLVVFLAVKKEMRRDA